MHRSNVVTHSRLTNHYTPPLLGKPSRIIRSYCTMLKKNSCCTQSLQHLNHNSARSAHVHGPAWRTRCSGGLLPAMGNWAMSVLSWPGNSVTWPFSAISFRSAAINMPCLPPSIQTSLRCAARPECGVEMCASPAMVREYLGGL